MNNDLQITSEEYFDMAKNIGRILSIPKSKRKRILERANKELSNKEKMRIDCIKIIMFNDKRVYNMNKLNYFKGSPDGILFTTAVADYFLRNKIN